MTSCSLITVLQFLTISPEIVSGASVNLYFALNANLQRLLASACYLLRSYLMNPKHKRNRIGNAKNSCLTQQFLVKNVTSSQTHSLSQPHAAAAGGGGLLLLRLGALWPSGRLSLLPGALPLFDEECPARAGPAPRPPLLPSRSRAS